MEVGLDLTKTNIKKFNEFQVIQESKSFDIEKAKEASKNIGLDLTKEKTGDIIDLTKYGKDIE
jgi:hypothetical protein